MQETCWTVEERQLTKNIYEKKILNQLILSTFVFNLHLSICSYKKFSLILIGYGGLCSQSLLASGMKCLIFIGFLTDRLKMFVIGQFETETSN